MDSAAAETLIRFMTFDSAAILVCLTCLVYMGLRHRLDKPQSVIFLVMVIDLSLTAMSNLAAGVIRNSAIGPTSLGAVETAGYVYFVTHSALFPLLLLYTILVCRGVNSGNQKRIVLLGIPFLALEIIALTNPFTHWMYAYGPDLVMTRNWGVYLAYIIGALYVFAAIAQLILRWRSLTNTKRSALTYFFVMAFAGTIVQLLVPPVAIELFAQSIAILGVMLFVENEEELIDYESDLYNRHALEADLSMYEKGNYGYNAVVVLVSNVDSYRNLDESTMASQRIAKLLSDYFRTIMPWYYVYRASSSRYVLIDPNLDYNGTHEVARSIVARFERSWEMDDATIDLHAIVALVSVPDDLQTASDVFYLIDSPAPRYLGKKLLRGKDFDYLMRRAEVERAVKRGLDEGGYEIYYQPIFGKDGTPHSAEALMRLNDSLLGMVSPLEFIEVAERTGLIEEVGEIALREVCAFLASGVPQSYGITRISVNLSVIQCMRSDFSSHAHEILASYGIEPDAVGFEITESVAAGDYEFLGKMMSQLKEGGHRFAMDDYGTGYSNMHSLVALDFDVVKIDKTVLWDAEKSDMGLVILQNGVSMVRDIGCEVLVEGVETEHQVNLLRLLNVDYYQGFYYAKPMPREAFVSFLENTVGKRA